MLLSMGDGAGFLLVLLAAKSIYSGRLLKRVMDIGFLEVCGGHAPYLAIRSGMSAGEPTPAWLLDILAAGTTHLTLTYGNEATEV